MAIKHNARTFTPDILGEAGSYSSANPAGNIVRKWDAPNMQLTTLQIYLIAEREDDQHKKLDGNKDTAVKQKR
jgi:hypothetical protein